NISQDSQELNSEVLFDEYNGPKGEPLARYFSDSCIASSASIRSFQIEAIKSYEISSEEFWQKPLVEISDKSEL
ncbi:1590_t:CDS:2, partial [Dentiscutata heterogama]